jgi:hypothetical protein
MLKNTAVIIIIILLFGLLKLNAPELTKALPEWAGGIIFFVVLGILVFQIVKFIFTNRRKDD